MVRQDTTGGACKAAFKKLPGVGAGMAKRWYDLGCRCFSFAAHNHAKGCLARAPIWPSATQIHTSACRRQWFSD